MPETNLSNATTSSLKSYVKSYKVDSEITDAQGTNQKEFKWYYSDANQQLGYFKTIPELRSAITALSVWTAGKGYDAKPQVQAILDNITGSGEDSFISICKNLIVQKKIFGDAFAEIIRDEMGKLLNLKPLYPGDMCSVWDNKGMLVRYEQISRTPNTENREIKPENILHLMNQRIANEVHGSSIVDSVKWVIDARNEAMEDWRRISHRSTVRVLYVDIDDDAKLTKVKTQYATGIKNGDVVILPVKKGDAEFQDLQLPPVAQFLNWIQYMENFFYQAVGVPRVIATSENYTEAASKVGYMTFEPIYTNEQTELENDLWNQVAIKIKFNRPPSLSNTMQESEQKNTGQTGFQPNDLNVPVERQ